MSPDRVPINQIVWGRHGLWGMFERENPLEEVTDLMCEGAGEEEGGDKSNVRDKTHTLSPGFTWFKFFKVP